MERTIEICGLSIPDLGKIKLMGASEEIAIVRFLDDHHFEMSNVHGEFDATGSHIWANTEFEVFCHEYGIKVEAVL